LLIQNLILSNLSEIVTMKTSTSCPKNENELNNKN